MARGITQAQVDVAADALLSAGERPTVERVRAHLGTGSPNTVTRLLESWWKRLGERINQQQQRMAIPEAPQAVQALAAQLWTLALEAGITQARVDLAQAQEACTADVSQAHGERDAALDAVAAAQAEADAARAERDQALTRIADLKRLADVQAAELLEVRASAHRTQEALDEAERTTGALRAALEAVRKETAETQAAHTAHMRQLEDRAHAQIDAARQQLRELTAQTARTQLAWRRTEDELREALEKSRLAAATAEQEAAVLRVRAEGLGQQLATLGDIPAVLRASLAGGAKKRGPRAAKPGKPVSKSEPTPSGRPGSGRRR